jgi:hypothetical protein
MAVSIVRAKLSESGDRAARAAVCNNRRSASGGQIRGADSARTCSAVAGGLLSSQSSCRPVSQDVDRRVWLRAHDVHVRKERHELRKGDVGVLDKYSEWSWSRGVLSENLSDVSVDGGGDKQGHWTCKTSTKDDD